MVRHRAIALIHLSSARHAALVALSVVLTAGCVDRGSRCSTDVDCTGLADRPFCDSEQQMCVAACTSDERSVYACIDGRRHYCSSDEALPCTACPGCGSGSYCDSATGSCAPQRTVGEACADRFQCASGSCFEGRCGVTQGEPCTDETCDGACAIARGTGESYCIRQCSGGASCASSARGLTWRCISFDWGRGPSYCLPVDDCTEDYSCFLQSSTCDLVCPSSGSCYNVCTPDVLDTP